MENESMLRGRRREGRRGRGIAEGRGRRRTRSASIREGNEEQEILAPQKKKNRSHLQLGVTEELLENVCKYVQQEYKLAEVQQKVSDVVSFSADSEEKERQEERLKRYIEAYITALLKYRVLCADAYSEGMDCTSNIPICVIPGGKRAQPLPGRKLFNELKKQGLPTKVPEGLRVKSRNNLLMAFRCFDSHRDGKLFFPFLRPNKELLALPGFGKCEEEVCSMISSKEKVANPFIWDALRGDIESFSSGDRERKALRRKVPGFEAFSFLREFWKEYMDATLRRKLQERLPSALESLEDLHRQNRSNSWLQAMKVQPVEKTKFTELVLQKKCIGVPIYEDRRGPYFIPRECVCVLWIEHKNRCGIRVEKVLGFMHRKTVQNMKKTWSMCVPGLWRVTGSDIGVQAVPVYRMTTDIRRWQTALMMDQMYPSIHRTCFSPRVAPGIVSSPQYLSIPGDNAAQIVFEHYKEELNMAQVEVLDKVMRVLSTNQIPAGNSLIAVQGPPGTGKSKTIVCIVALLLAKLEFPEYKGRKVLVCAPSNAAVDVVARRLLKGVQIAVPDEKDPSILNLKPQTPSILRIGPGCMDPDLRSINVNEKVDFELDRMGTLHPKEKELRRARLEREFLTDAKVWCSTLMNIRQDKYVELNPRFLGAIIDEAGQAIELDCYMPLISFRGDPAPLCVLVGDTKQLSPFEDIYEGRAVVEKGMMGRIVDYMQHTSNNCVRLQEQYRMHYAIAAFPAKEFYAGHLRNAPIVYDARTFERPYHFDAAGRFGPVTFIDTKSMRNKGEDYRSSSACNYCEADVVESLVVCLVRLHQSALDDGVVLLSPYSRQLELLSYASSKVPEMKQVAVSTSTVDSMQGDEAGVVIMSTVRSNSRKDLGFLVDYRRMNVGMTRAKYSLIVVGDSTTLEANGTWGRFIDYCRDDENRCTHYICIQGKSVNQNEVTQKLFPEKLISTGTQWNYPRF